MWVEGMNNVELWKNDVKTAATTENCNLPMNFLLIQILSELGMSESFSFLWLFVSQQFDFGIAFVNNKIWWFSAIFKLEQRFIYDTNGT